MQSTNFVPRIGALAAIIIVALTAYSVVVATPQAPQTPEAAAAAFERQYSDPSLAGLSVAPGAADGNVEMSY